MGAEELFGANSRTRNSREVILRITVHHTDPAAMRAFGLEIAPVRVFWGGAMGYAVRGELMVGLRVLPAWHPESREGEVADRAPRR